MRYIDKHDFKIVLKFLGDALQIIGMSVLHPPFSFMKRKSTGEKEKSKINFQIFIKFYPNAIH